MNKTLTRTAVTLALGATLLVPFEAAARPHGFGPGPRHGPPPVFHHHHHGPGPAGFLAAGLFGVALGAALASEPAPVYRQTVVYAPPAPVYVRQPAPVYVQQPAPVYVQPAPTVIQQPSPVYVQPAPVYVQPSPVYVQPAPCNLTCAPFAQPVVQPAAPATAPATAPAETSLAQPATAE